MYNSPVPTNNDLYAELDDMLSNGFEDNIVNVFSAYIEDKRLDGEKYARIAKFYTEAKDAYLDAVASIIMHPEALDYLDYPRL